MTILIAVILIILGALAILFFLLPPAVGAPFVPTNNAVVAAMLRLAAPRAGERMVDLGSGDGRIVMAFALAGVEAHGYETNPSLVLWSCFNIWRLGLRNKAHIHWQSFNACDFSQFAIVTTYILPRFMAALEGKLRESLPPGGRVVAHQFKFPNWQPTQIKDKVYLYVSPAQ